MRCLLLCAPLLLLFPAGLQARQATDYQHYPINGSTAEELLRQMETLGPAQHDGQRYPGGAHWSIDWRYSTSQQGGRCRIGQLQVNLKSTITLPQWQQREQAAPDLAEAWDSFLAKLDIHEQGHVKQGEDAAEQVRQALRGMAASNCKALDEQANQRGMQIIEQYSQRDIDYDEQTGHGRTQGAVLAY